MTAGFGLRRLLGKILPPPASSFHSKMDDVNARLEALSAQVRENRELLEASMESLRQGVDSRKVFYLIAEPGYPNYGDELIAAEWLKYLARVHPDVPVVLDCARPGPASAILRRVHPHLTVVDTIARLTLENEFNGMGVERLPDIVRFVGEALRDESQAARYVSGIHLLQQDVRSIHILGGGYLNARWYANLARLEVGPWAKSRQGENIPVMMTGAGLMPLSAGTSSAEYVRRALSTFDVCTLRDEASYQAVHDLPNCEIAPDDCFVNGLDGCYFDDGELPDTMVCIQSDLVEDTEALYAHVLAVLRTWNVDTAETIGVVECNPYVDYPILPYLENAGYHVRFFPASDLLEHGFPARPGQRWLSTRYHPHLLAAARGCSGSYIAVDDEYYGIKHQAVVRMGSRWTASPIGGKPVTPGPGFEDPDVSRRYAECIRRTASLLYGYGNV